MYDYLKELEKEHKTDLLHLKMQWEAMKFQVEMEKDKNPKMGEKLDAYLNTLKNSIKELLSDDEDWDEDSLADYNYIFGEENED
jgi:hypothetical protein